MQSQTLSFHQLEEKLAKDDGEKPTPMTVEQ